MGFRIFLSPPNIGGREQEYVKEAFHTRMPRKRWGRSIKEKMCGALGDVAVLSLLEVKRWIDMVH